MEITKQRYVEYVISTLINYTCTNLANHLDGISHDAINDYLRRERHTAHTVWELAEPLINNSNEAYLILDDSVQDKSYSQKIEMVNRQYSGNAHGLIKGIGIVNLVHADQSDYYPLDFRVYAPAVDGKTKNDHFRDMLRQAFEERGLKAQVTIPRQSRGLSFMSRSKRLVGVANAAPSWGPPKGGVPVTETDRAVVNVFSGHC
ncbi:MAG TPA: transposase [Candidatus Paceibacterota bacterium]|nr:transposase [Candidatus Paceibacterota bacterium]